jgi:S-adenosylmethionine/arginine decarboxylase-like enzyme
MGKKLSHLHLTLNAKIKPLKGISEELASSFVKDLLSAADMKALGPLIFSGAEDLDFPGQSFVQMITTSHCSLHFFSDTNEIYFDLYSCKQFNPAKIINIINSYFGIEVYHGMIYKRGNSKEVSISKIGRW